ncbi:MAG: molecular chaperone TorD family protein [Coriobacteriales bacterium]|jgi:TorA maturation chaperone TorD|nr:molecular chaperone TorD family protein [Coriobacteriales bacterium]
MSTSSNPLASEDERQVLASVLADRVSSYRMFSRLFLKPLAEEDIQALVDMDLVERAKELEGSELLAEGFNDMGRGLRRRHTGTRQQLGTDFTMCFDGVQSVEEKVAVPYASVFLSEKALLNQEPRLEVYMTFQAERIHLKQGIDLPEDHLSFELEFLALLSNSAQAALEKDNPAEAVRNLKVSAEFIRVHILSWYDLLTERANQIIKTRFYRGVLKATKGYLELDLETINDLVEALEDEQSQQ